ncbi:MAG: hypothetical protein HQK50_19185 [Oligoflexia bacterium]|nr:hypothetical protein [Oligoflexia bacterium]
MEKKLNSLSLLNNSDQLALMQLDWGAIIDQISKHIYFYRAQLELRKAVVPKDRETIEQTYTILERLSTLLREAKTDSLYSLFSSLDREESFHNSLSFLSKGATLELYDLHKIAKLIECYQSVNNEIGDILKNICIYLKQELDHKNILHLFSKFISEFRKLLSRDGEIQYEHHPELRGPYIELKRTEEDIRYALKEILRSSTFEKILQIDEYDIINDHYVIAIRSDSYKSIYGQIIAHSDSGLTLYIEPFSIRNKCNKRIALLAKIDEIIFTICHKHSEALRPHAALLESIQSVFEMLDLFLAKATIKIYLGRLLLALLRFYSKASFILCWPIL